MRTVPPPCSVPATICSCVRTQRSGRPTTGASVTRQLVRQLGDASWQSCHRSVYSPAAANKVQCRHVDGARGCQLQNRRHVTLQDHQHFLVALEIQYSAPAVHCCRVSAASRRREAVAAACSLLQSENQRRRSSGQNQARRPSQGSVSAR